MKSGPVLFPARRRGGAFRVRRGVLLEPVVQRLGLMPSTAAACFFTPLQRSSVARIRRRSASAKVSPTGTLTWPPSPAGDTRGVSMSTSSVSPSAMMKARRT